MLDNNMNATNHVKLGEDEDEEVFMERTFLSLDDYDCIGFDLDHTLCRYNIGPMIRFEYDLLAAFLVEKRGYDPSIKQKTFDSEAEFVCKVCISYYYKSNGVNPFRSSEFLICGDLRPKTSPPLIRLARARPKSL